MAAAKDIRSFPIRLKLSEAASSGGRIPGLDGLRALSIMIVMCGHFLVPGFGGFAAFGVYIFFAISGFLITRLLYAELKARGSISIRNFYLRRILRLYPVLIVYLITLLAVDAWTGEQPSYLEVSSVLFYFVNYLSTFKAMHGDQLTMQVGVLWSLSIEEHFYLMAPVFLALVKGRLRPMLWFVGLACTLPLVLRCIYVIEWPEIIGRLVTYVNSETRFDSIAFGVLLAILAESDWGRRVIAVLSTRTAFVFGVAMIAISMAIPDAVFKETLRFSTLSFATIPLICGTVFGEKLGMVQWVANSRPVVWVGKLSYSLYVWHGCVIYFMTLAGLTTVGLAAGFGKLAIVFVLASLSYTLVEQPFLRLKHIFARVGEPRGLPAAEPVQ
ncbi:MAG: acyltransferase [Ancalomicrobiaceae bacterium]|nr:acyltransferase [Ancalomicrobiaceae bacterium]